MERLKMGSLALACAIVMLTGATAFAATHYATTFEANPKYNAMRYSGSIASALIETNHCIKERGVSVYQLKPDDTKRILASGETDKEGNFYLPKQREVKGLGDIFVKVKEKLFGDPIGSKMCDVAKTKNIDKG
jgi:hypothetical protein